MKDEHDHVHGEPVGECEQCAGAALVGRRCAICNQEMRKADHTHHLEVSPIFPDRCLGCWLAGLELEKFLVRVLSRRRGRAGVRAQAVFLESVKEQTMSETTITLRDIEQSVSGLLEILEDPTLTEEERAVAQDELARWVDAEIVKVDRVRGFLRHCRTMEAVAKDTAKEYAERAKLWDERRRRLNDLCMAIMEQRGVKKLEGAGGFLRIQANGGRQELTISDEKLIPDEFRMIRIVAPVKLLRWLPLEKLIAAGAKVSYETNTDKVRLALDEPCPACNAAGRFPCVASLASNGEILAVAECPACGGSGKSGVPGARLEPRGIHLRID